MSSATLPRVAPVAVAVLALVVPTAAAATWGPVVRVPGRGLHDTTVAVDRHGTTTAAWARSDGRVVVARHPRGAGWSRPKVLGVGAWPQVGTVAG